jgi:hypothetical protein
MLNNMSVYHMLVILMMMVFVKLLYTYLISIFKHPFSMVHTSSKLVFLSYKIKCRRGGTARF